MHQRIESLDMAKGLGIVAVLVLHICVLGTVGNILFMVLFGYLMPFYFFTSGYTYKTGRGIGFNIKRRAGQILLPFLKYTIAVSVICISWDVIRGQATIAQGLNDALRGVIGEDFLWLHLENYMTTVGVAMRAYWFMRQMFLSSVIFFLVADFALKSRKRTVTTAVALIVASFLLIQFLPVELPLDLDCSPAFAGLMLLGSAANSLGIFRPESRKNKWFWPALIASALISAACAVFFPGIHLLARGSFGNYGGWSVFTSVIQGLTGTYVLIQLCGVMESVNPVRRVLLYLGKNTIPILMLHMIIASLITQITPLKAGYNVTNVQVAVSAETIVSSVVVLVITMALCLGITEIMNRWALRKR